MTRILQLRRGTTAENDNFTGLPGEITMDLDAKTLRIHDGERLGGYILQPTDTAATDTGAFDVTAVPDEYWEALFAKYTPGPFSVVESRPAPMNSNVAGLNCAIGGDKIPYFVRAVLVCQSADAGYVSGDRVWAFGVGDYSAPLINCFVDENGLNIRLMVGGQRYWTPHRDTGIKTELTDANWQILFYVYY